jgi:hypothetical protein
LRRVLALRGDGGMPRPCGSPKLQSPRSGTGGSMS